MSLGDMTIVYNGQNPFAGKPTPFVGLDYQDIYYGERWAQAETVTLQGQLTGCTFDLLYSGQLALLNSFNQSFQPFQIWQQTGSVGTGLVFSKEFVEVQSVDFPTSRWFGIQPYTVSLRCYPSGLFSGAFGVLNPVDTWDYQEQSNLALGATHTISAQGFNTSAGASNALENARAWVWGRTGLGSAVASTFIANVNTADFCLLTQNESIDRLNGTYTLTERYTNDLTRTGYGVLRYTTSISSGDNLLTISLQGQIEGCSRNITSARAVFNRLDKLSTALFSYTGLYKVNDINPLPVSQTVTEDPFNAVVTFGYVYNNDNSPPVVFDYEVALSSGTNIEASIQGTVTARSGDVNARYAQAQAYVATQDLYGLTNTYYQSFYPYSWQFPLNPVPVSSGASYNPTNGSVSVNATFSNNTQVSPTFDRFDYSISFQPATEQLDIKPVVSVIPGTKNGVYSVVDLGYKTRATLTIRGEVLINPSANVDQAVAEVKQVAVQLFTQYGSTSEATLDRDVLTFSRFDERQLTFEFAWSFASSNQTAASPYSTISTLAVK